MTFGALPAPFMAMAATALETNMGSPKLSRHQIDNLRRVKDRIDLEATGRVWGVHPHTIRRALQGKTWADGAHIGRLPDEFRACCICNKEFSRRFADGRYRSASVWLRKQTCSRSCAAAQAWRDGVYANRKK